MPQKNKTSFAPDFCFDLIAKAFSDEAHPSYAQIATSDEKNGPHVRTVHIHYLADLHRLAFSTHTGSAKWNHLKKNPALSGCYLDLFRQIQFRWETQGELQGKPQGKPNVELIDDTHNPYPNLLEMMWLRMRVDVRRAYWMDYKNLPPSQIPPRDVDLQKRSPNQGVVLCSPTLWNIYEMHEEDYTKGSVTLHELKDEHQWYSKQISLLGRQ